MCRHLHPDWTINVYQCNWKNVKLNWDFHEFQSRFKRDHDYSIEAKSLLYVNFKEYDPIDKKVLEMPPPNISDIFSYDILSREGGWYADLDIAFIRPFDDLCDSGYGFIGFGGLDDWVGIFGAKQGSWVMKSFYDACIDNYDAECYNSTGTFGIIKNCTSHMGWQNKFKEGDGGDKNWRAPKEMFYPLRPQQSSRLWSKTFETPRPMTWAVHLYGGNSDYAIMNKVLMPSYLWNVNNLEWFCRYVRSLGNKKLFLTEDPFDITKNIVKEVVHDQHNLPDIQEKQNEAAPVLEFALGEQLQQKFGQVHNDSEQPR
jgi:hypothetical protein